MSGERDPQRILDKANAGVPLLSIEICRIVEASGEDVPKPRTVRQMVQDADEKFRALLQAELGEDLAVLFEERSIKPRRRVRRVR